MASLREDALDAEPGAAAPTAPSAPTAPTAHGGASRGADRGASRGADTLRRERARGHAALVVVQLCFGTFPLLAKWAFDAFDPFAIAGWRVLFGAAALLAVAFAVHGREALPARRELPRLAACALLGVVLNQVLFLEGLSRSTAVNAGLIMPLIPVYTFLVAWMARQERFSLLRGVGILIAFAGTTQLLLQKEPDLSRPHLVGNLLIATNALSYSIFLVVSRPLAQRMHPLALIAWVYAFATLSVPFFTRGVDFVPPAAGARAWISLGLILAFPTVLGYVLNTYALSKVSASTTAVYVYLQPLIAGATGVLVLGERLGAGIVLAAVAIFVGIRLVVLRPASAPSPRAPEETEP